MTDRYPYLISFQKNLRNTLPRRMSGFFADIKVAYDRPNPWQSLSLRPDRMETPTGWEHDLYTDRDTVDWLHANQVKFYVLKTPEERARELEIEAARYEKAKGCPYQAGSFDFCVLCNQRRHYHDL